MKKPEKKFVEAELTNGCGRFQYVPNDEAIGYNQCYDEMESYYQWKIRRVLENLKSTTLTDIRSEFDQALAELGKGDRGK